MRKRTSAHRLDGDALASAEATRLLGGSHLGGPGATGTWAGWLATILAVAAAGAFVYAALSSSRARAVAGVRQQAAKCYALSDAELVRSLGADALFGHRAIATASPAAQVLFDLGLLAAHGFNQDEATAMFQAALRADPACGMCHWGLAMAQGPMPNKLPGKTGAPYPAFLPAHAAAAQRHVQAAQHANQAALMATGQGPAAAQDSARLVRERALIAAAAARFAGGAAAVTAGQWQQEHEEKYAASLQALAEQAQDDPDLYAFAAEALMSLTAWDYYEPGSGQLRPTAATAEALLVKALALSPNHTHALHLHIHITEAGVPGPPPPGGAALAANAAARGLASAHALTRLAPPNAHLLHMPSHTYVRVGDYARAVAANKAAYATDIARASSCLVPYLPEHNVNMLVYAASMAGLFHTAQSFATGMRTLRTRVPDTWIARGNEWVSLPLLHIRYGQWRELLRQPPPPSDARGVTTLGGPQCAAVVHHAGRLLALAARAQSAAEQLLTLGDATAFDLARKSLVLREKEVAREHELLKAAISAVPHEPVTLPGPPPGMYASAYASLAALLGSLAEARLSLLHNNTAAAAEALREAVAIEDSLGYMEPPRVHQPMRQCLAWVLLHAGRISEAAAVYEQDLQRLPLNGWSLLGLKQAAQAAGNTSRAAALEEQRKQAWVDAEVQIPSSCPALSQPGPGGRLTCEGWLM